MSENIIQTEFSAEMQQSFLNYSMSVITARAVPDVRDGLKPVQRRVLYAMNELGLNSDKPHRKSARIVGDTMGKYHPHGDSSIYETLVVLSQDFKKGMALVDGHGNFGSIEGDGAAAMRYTEARLKKFTQDVYLADLDKDVVDFVPNFDETEKEPSVLPVRIPNVLVNGSEGIAVGMTTSIPTHNLGEVVDGMKYLMDYPDASCEELMQFIKGPDFPTGGIVTNKDELLKIYETGKGKIKLRGMARIEYAKKRSEKDCIVITEIPYTMIGANIGKFLSDVMELAESKKLPDITDISNQSKDEVRIVIELKKGADAEKILQGLYKKTKLEDSFGVNMLVIADGKPKVMGLKEILHSNIEFQIEINTRKYTTLLKKEQEKKEVQEGLIAAVDIIDLIIEIIRGSKDLKMARGCLMSGITEGIRFKTKTSQKQAARLRFTERQANAILELRLAKLIGLEILALQKEHDETLKRIESYQDILQNKDAMKRAIKKDLDHIKKTYALPRKTVIENSAAAVFEEVPVQAVPCVFAMNRFGYVKTFDPGVYSKNEQQLLAENKVVFECMSDSRVGVFTREGMLHQIRLKDVPLCKVKDKGVPLDNISNYDSTKENICAVLPMDELPGKNIVFITESGLGKRVEGDQVVSAKKSVAASRLSEGDALAAVFMESSSQLILVTTDVTGLRLMISELPVQKKTAMGVRTIKLTGTQKVRSVWQINEGESLSAEIDGETYVLSDLKCKKRDSRAGKLKKT